MTSRVSRKEKAGSPIEGKELTHSNTVVALNSFNNIIITRKVSAKDTLKVIPQSEIKPEKFPRESIKLKKKTSP